MMIVSVAVTERVEPGGVSCGIIILAVECISFCKGLLDDEDWNRAVPLAGLLRAGGMESAKEFDHRAVQLGWGPTGFRLEQRSSRLFCTRSL